MPTWAGIPAVTAEVLRRAPRQRAARPPAVRPPGGPVLLVAVRVRELRKSGIHPTIRGGTIPSIAASADLLNRTYSLYAQLLGL